MSSIPRWSLHTIYTGITDQRFTTDLNTIHTLHTDLIESCRTLEKDPSCLSETIDLIEKLIITYGELHAYVYCRYSVDTRDKEALQGISTVKEAGLKVREALIVFKNALGSISRSLEDVYASSKDLLDYRFIISELLEEQKHQMSPEEESLAADLNRSGADAWGRLQEAVLSSASAPWDGAAKTVVELRSLAFDPDRSVRKRAYEAELEVWKQHELPLAFCINGVKGTTVSLEKRRKFQDPLDKALMTSRVSPTALNSLISAMEESLPMFRGYLHSKAKLLGIQRCAFYDLFAPAGSSTQSWSYPQARDFIIEQFSRFHQPMAQLAETAFAGGWIDAEPRAGKVGGAYCIGFPASKESRILCNFDGSFSSVTTIAHELGHAYHGHLLREQPALLQDYPMPLAETASIFAETVIFNGQLASSDASQRLGLIEGFLQDAVQVIVDIISRFYFERELFSRRKQGELAADDLCSIMTDAQKAAYGDGLDEQALHPYMWAVKPHYYSSELSYYNFPYAFGLLFGLGLYARYLDEGSSFTAEYDSLLVMTGKQSVKDVAAAAGIDVEDREFWRSGISIISDYVKLFNEEVRS